MRKIILAAVVFTVIYNILFFQTDWGIGSGLLFLFLNLFAYNSRDDQAKNMQLGIVAAVLSIIFGFMIGWRSNEIIQLINLILALFFNLVALYFYKSGQTFSFEIPQLLLIPMQVIAGSIKGISTIFVARESSEIKKEDGVSNSIIRGLAIAVPVSVLLLVLLVRADPIFNKLVENFFSDIWERLIISIIVFFGLLSFGIAKVYEVMKPDAVEEQKDFRHKIYELLIITGSVATLFAIFILIQFRYFFAGNIGERELHELGINSLTYSEYVRKGFFELLAASAIGSLIILYITRYIHKLQDKQRLITQVVSAILVSEIGLLLFSALQRLNLYQQAHGLTRARVFGFVFLVWLLVMLIFFLIRITQEVKKELLFKLIVSLTLILILVLNIINIDGLIAVRYRPTVNEEIDYFYLMSLSNDAHQSWISAIKDSERVIGNLEAVQEYNSEHYRQLYWARTPLYLLHDKVNYLEQKFSKMRKWPAWNLGEQDAYMVIVNNQDSFSKLESLLQRANNIDSKISDQVKSSTTLDRATQPPLL